MADETRTDEQFWEDFAKTIEEAKQLPEWKRRYRIMIYDEPRAKAVAAPPVETK